jgi:hypothetical protein
MSSAKTVFNLNFLAQIAEKTVIWKPTEFQPNMEGEKIPAKMSEFTAYAISKADFKKVLDIVHEETLVVLPKENLMGFLEGYDVCDLECKLILRFGEPNLPKDSGFTLEKLYASWVRSESNLELYELLKMDGKTLPKIHECAEQHCY